MSEKAIKRESDKLIAQTDYIRNAPTARKEGIAVALYNKSLLSAFKNWDALNKKYAPTT